MNANTSAKAKAKAKANAKAAVNAKAKATAIDGSEVQSCSVALRSRGTSSTAVAA